MLLESRSTIRGSHRPGVRLPPHASGDRPVGRRLRGGPPPVVRDAERTRFVAPIRLRYLMLLGLLGLSIQTLVPRALAYWQLHGVATELADYALCMVGPTGPTLLRERPSEFWRLVRRRLVASPPEARPFAGCAPAVAASADAEARRRFHQAKAQDFREYAPFRATSNPSLSLGDLTVTTARVEALAKAASIFMRTPYAELVRPSRNARAVPHPVELPTPIDGRGLPSASIGHAQVRSFEGGYLLVGGNGADSSAYRSRDGGMSWSAVDVDSVQPRSTPGACSVGPSPASFKLAVSGEQLSVESWLHSALETSFPLASADSRLLAFSCDNTAALAIVHEEGQSRPAFRICPHRARCRDVPPPLELRDAPRAEAVLSAARVRGVAVLSVAYQGVVRIFSSRNDGETWTPSVVAYDREEHQARDRVRATPTQLLALDARVLLYAGADRAGQSYPVLASDDFGASWLAR
jgi:hypothetical protein